MDDGQYTGIMDSEQQKMAAAIMYGGQPEDKFLNKLLDFRDDLFEYEQSLRGARFNVDTKSYEIDKPEETINEKGISYLKSEIITVMVKSVKMGKIPEARALILTKEKCKTVLKNIMCNLGRYNIRLEDVESLVMGVGSLTYCTLTMSENGMTNRSATGSFKQFENTHAVQSGKPGFKFGGGANR